jgi:alkylation response protein AidB-like acyl-CoA dehydrogenase
VTSALADADELRQLRGAIRGVIGPPGDGAEVTAVDWRTAWPTVAQLGVTGFCVPEAQGGYGLAAEAAVAAAEELGAALHGSPYAGIVASAHALASSNVTSTHPAVADIVDGRRVVAFGVLDADLTLLDDGGVRGIARLVDGAVLADAFVLAVPNSRDLLLIEDSKACEVIPSTMAFDVTRRSGDIVLDGVPALRITSAHVAPELFRLLLAADALGGVQRMFDRTVAYAIDRQAFGRPIGGFQAVQHRLVDHTVRLRGMRLVVAEAARAVAANDPGAAHPVALAELAVSSGAVHVLHDLLQLTGAIGFTWEHGLHLYERRAHHDARLVGNPRAAIRNLAALEGWTR